MAARRRENVGKRKRSDSYDLNVRYIHNTHYADGYITSLDSRGLLADIYWELKRFKANKPYEPVFNYEVFYCQK